MISDVKLNCFLSVARLGSFTKAADELFMARQSVSRQIQMLENDLDTQLFIRSANQVELSDDGRAYYELFRRQMSEFSELRTKLSKKSQNSIRLRIGLLSGISVSGSISAILDIFRNDSRVESIELERWNPDVLFSRFQSGQLDLIFCFVKQAFHSLKDADANASNFKRLGETLMVLAASESHPKASSAKIAQDFQNEIFISCSDAARNGGAESQIQTLKGYGLNPAGFKDCVNLESAITELMFGNAVLIASNSLELIHQPGIKLFSVGRSESQVCLWHSDEDRPVMLELTRRIQQESF